MVASEPGCISPLVPSQPRSVYDIGCFKPRVGSTGGKPSHSAGVVPSAVKLAREPERALCGLRILRGKSLLVQSGNRTVVSYIRNQGGTRSAPLCELASTLLTMTSQLDITLSAYYIPGPYNEIADSLSRGKLISDWHLSKHITHRIFRKWDIPQIDLFATHLSRVVPLYVSRNAQDPLACFVDAFSRAWNFTLAWVFPPPSLVPRVLSHLNTASGTYILIVPRWEQVFWRADLKSRALAPPFQLRNLHHHLSEAQTGLPLKQASSLRLEAWKVRGGKGVLKDGPRKT